MVVSAMPIKDGLTLEVDENLKKRNAGLRADVPQSVSVTTSTEDSPEQSFDNMYFIFAFAVILHHLSS